jgi:hypothetical protein
MTGKPDIFRQVVQNQMTVSRDAWQSEAPFIQKQALTVLCMEAFLELAAFAKEQIINIHSAVVQSFKIALAF